MDSFFKKAQEFASASLKKSQELATTAAAQSRELATETAKQTRIAAQSSYKAAAEASKKAEIKLKQLAQDLNSKPGSGQASKEQELQEAGITEELIDFIRGIDIKTFRQFPLEDALSAREAGGLPRSDSGTSENGESPSEKTPKEQGVDSSELTPFQEHHATLVLKAVQEVADFRYVLCPRRMKESRFWKIYFTLVHSHISPYEARWQAAQAAKKPANPPADVDPKEPAKPGAAANTAASIAETMKPLQESFLVGIQEVRAGLTQAGRTIASKVSSTSSTKASAPEKPKPPKSGIRDLTAVKEALNASSDVDKKPAVRKTNGAVQTTNAVETTEANAGKAVIPETDRNATAGGEQSQDKEGGGKEKTEDHDLDAYLMGALDDDVDDDDDGEGFNEEDFEKLVNSSGYLKDENKAGKSKDTS